jgi:DNA-binding protein YbaB
MEDDDIESRSKRLLLEINKLQKELEEIQSSCKHENFKIELRDGFLVKICTACNRKLGYPSQQEKEKSGYI